jgi:hypothetical protein
MSVYRSSVADLSPEEKVALEELTHDLVGQLADGVLLPAAIAVTPDSLSKITMPMDSGGQPISDAQIGLPLIEYLQRDSSDRVVVGFVRIDADRPYINIVDLRTGRVTRAEPNPGPEVTWELIQLAELDQTPVGGGEGTLIQFDSDQPEEVAAQALQHIGHDCLGALVALVDEERPSENAAIFDQLTYDAGPVWSHDEVPPATSHSMPLGKRLQQLDAHTAEVPSNTIAFRFHHRDEGGDFIYLFGRHQAAQGTSRFLARATLVEPGLLGPVEHLPSDELAQLLGSEESA